MWRFGDGTEPSVTVRISDPRAIRRMLTNPDIAAAEAYMNGTLTIDGTTSSGCCRLRSATPRRAASRCCATCKAAGATSCAGSTSTTRSTGHMPMSRITTICRA
ncbi:MAG: hypothetical protein JKP98_26830, partial [Rhodobacteraceae bacterium]|nr:hypothetical protein [Paracoccaceae bacterium]